MKDNRRSIKVVPIVKAEIESIRAELGLKTESHVIAYLTSLYTDQKKNRIKLAEHQAYIKESEEKHNQLTI